MKKINWIMICDIVAIALFIASIILSSNASTVVIGTVCLCFGFAALGIGIWFSRKERAKEEQKKTEPEQIETDEK